MMTVCQPLDDTLWTTPVRAVSDLTATCVPMAKLPSPVAAGAAGAGSSVAASSSASPSASGDSASGAPASSSGTRLAGRKLFSSGSAWPSSVTLRQPPGRTSLTTPRTRPSATSTPAEPAGSADASTATRVPGGKSSAPVGACDSTSSTGAGGAAAGCGAAGGAGAAGSTSMGAAGGAGSSSVSSPSSTSSWPPRNDFSRAVSSKRMVYLRRVDVKKNKLVKNTGEKGTSRASSA